MKYHPLPVTLAMASVLMVGAASCAGLAGARPPVRHNVQPPAHVKPFVPAPVVPSSDHPLIGVAAQPAAQWQQVTGHRPDLAVAYVSMSKPLVPAFMRWAQNAADGGEPVLELLPRGYTLTQVAAGAADGWLRTLRSQIAIPVVVAFAPEADGIWYSWGYHPAQFVAAWRHVHSVLGTKNITWMWQMSAHPSRNKPLSPYWPGKGEADWVGIDGYFSNPATTFRSRFGTALQVVRRLTSVPVIISETAIGQHTGRSAVADVTQLFDGMRAWHVSGFIWFDSKQAGGQYHQDWRISDKPEVLAAFLRLAGYDPAMGLSAFRLSGATA